jgi:hypothetical protein
LWHWKKYFIKRKTQLQPVTEEPKPYNDPVQHIAKRAKEEWIFDYYALWIISMSGRLAFDETKEVFFREATFKCRLPFGCLSHFIVCWAVVLWIFGEVNSAGYGFGQSSGVHLLWLLHDNTG